MQPGQIKIITRITALPGEDVLLERLLRALLTPTRDESGCISIELLRHQTDRTEFVLCEIWEDTSSADAHFNSLHFKDTLRQASGLLACAPDIRRYMLVNELPLNG